MGIFGATTTVALRLGVPQVIAGEVLPAVVELGEPDTRARGARVELLYRNTFREDTTAPDGEASTTKRREDVVVLSQPVAELRAGRLEAALPVPAGVPGTAPGSVEWAVRVVVDRARARDAVAEQPLVVLVPAAQLAGFAQAPLEGDPELGLDLRLAERTVRPGGRVAGTVVLRPTEALEARSVRVRLHRVRYDPDDNEDRGVAAEAVLTREVRLGAGEPFTAAFSLDLPVEAPPSFAALHNEQRWYLEVVLDRQLLPDRTARLEVAVATA